MLGAHQRADKQEALGNPDPPLQLVAGVCHQLRALREEELQAVCYTTKAMVRKGGSLKPETVIGEGLVGALCYPMVPYGTLNHRMGSLGRGLCWSGKL